MGEAKGYGTQGKQFCKINCVTLCLQIRVLQNNWVVNTIYRIAVFQFTFVI